MYFSWFNTEARLARVVVRTEGIAVWRSQQDQNKNTEKEEKIQNHLGILSSHFYCQTFSDDDDDDEQTIEEENVCIEIKRY